MDAIEILRRGGVRLTPVRLQVLRSLSRLGYPISHPDLARLPGFEACDRVTLYRTLKLLREAGLVHAVQGVDGAWRFCAHETDAAGCPGGHPHFLCRSCGRMSCLRGQRIPHIEVPADMQVQGKQLVAYGRCSACAARHSSRLRVAGNRRRTRA